MNALAIFDALETPLYEEPLFPVEVRDRGVTPEAQRQGAFRTLLGFTAPTIMSWGVPNGGKRGLKAQAQARREGLKPGVFDEHYAGPDRWEAILEWKDGTGRLSPAQIEWGNAMHRRGFRVACVRTPEYAALLFRDWGAPMKAVS